MIEADRSIGLARALPRGQPPPLIQHDQHVLDHAILQRIGQLDRIAIGHVALRIGDGDIAGGDDLPGLAVPYHAIGAQPVAIAIHLDGAGDGNDIALAIIFQRIGAELDLIRIAGIRRRRPGCGRRRGTVVEVLRLRRHGGDEQWQGTAEKVATAHGIRLLHSGRREAASRPIASPRRLRNRIDGFARTPVNP